MARPVSALTTFIRSLPVDLPVKDVLAQAKAAGHETSPSNVSRVRAEMAKATPKKAGSKPASTSKKAASKKLTAPRKVTAPTKSAAPGTARSAGVSKSAFIRLHPSLSAAEVIAAGKDQGLTFTRTLVYNVRQGTATKGGKGTGKTPAPKKAAAAKKTSPAKKAPASNSASPSKSAFIRDLPLTLSAKEVVAQGKAAGLTFDDKYVHNIRRAAVKKTASVKKTSASAKKAAPSKGTASKKTATSKSTAPKQAPSTVSKADFVRERGHLSPKEIVEDAKAVGVELDANHVYSVRGYDQRASKTKRASSKKTSSPKPTVAKSTTSPSAPTSKPPVSNGTRPSGSTVEDLLRAVAAELGLGRAMEILAGERARVRAVMGG